MVQVHMGDDERFEGIEGDSERGRPGCRVGALLQATVDQHTGVGVEMQLMARARDGLGATVMSKAGIGHGYALCSGRARYYGRA